MPSVVARAPALFYHFQAQLVVEQVGSGLLEWVHGRNHEPHLIQAGLLAKAFANVIWPVWMGLKLPPKIPTFFISYSASRKALTS